MDFHFESLLGQLRDMAARMERNSDGIEERFEARFEDFERKMEKTLEGMKVVSQSRAI